MTSSGFPGRLPRDPGDSGNGGPPPGPGGLPRASQPGGPPDAPPPSEGGSDEHLELSIQGVRTAEGEGPGELKVELNTTRGVITMHLYPCEGKTGTAIYLGGAAGGVRGPANEVYVRLGRELVQEGVTSLRVEYRKPGEFEECVVDAMAACSFLKGIGATATVIVGHSFGGAVAVKAGELADLAAGVVGMSSQRFGTQDVQQLGKPLLLIHGSNDDILDRAASDDIYGRAEEPKQLVILEGAGHGLLEAADDVHAILRDFITHAVGDGADRTRTEAT